MKHLRLVLVALLLCTPAIAQQQQFSVLTQVNHSPMTPTVNSTVQFRATVKAGSVSDVSNITLVVNTPTISRYLMDQDANQFTTGLVFDTPGNVSYHVEIFDEFALIEVSAIIIFEVVDREDNQQIRFQSNYTAQVSAGNYSLNDDNGNFQLQFQLNKSAKLNVSEMENEPQISGKIILSTGYSIGINDTTALTQANLTLRYHNTLVEELGIDPSLIQFYSRNESSISWYPEISQLDPVNKTIRTQPHHFSMWVLAASMPQVKFLSFPEDIIAETSSYVTLPTTIKNFGSYHGNNLTVRLISPSTVLSNNLSTSVLIDEIGPLEEIPMTWEIFFTEDGNYTLVLVAEGDEIDGDVILIHVTVTHNETSSQENSVIFHAEYTIVMIVMMVIFFQETIMKRLLYGFLIVLVLNTPVLSQTPADSLAISQIEIDITLEVGGDSHYMLSAIFVPQESISELTLELPLGLTDPIVMVNDSLAALMLTNEGGVSILQITPTQNLNAGESYHLLLSADFTAEFSTVETGKYNFLFDWDLNLLSNNISVSLHLPSSAIIHHDGVTPLIFPNVADFTTDGSRITLTWTELSNTASLNTKIFVEFEQQVRVEQQNPDQQLTIFFAGVIFILLGTIAYLFYQLRRAGQTIPSQTRVITSIKPMILSPQEMDILTIISNHDGGILQSDLVDLLKYSRARVSQYLTSFEERGLISKHKTGRLNYITLASEVMLNRDKD